MSGNAKKTATVSRSTSGDGTAVIAAPGAGYYVHIFGGMLVQADPGNDDGVATVKSGSNTLLPIALTGGVYGALLPEMVGGDNEAIYVNLSAAVDVKGAISYAVRSSAQLQD